MTEASWRRSGKALPPGLREQVPLCERTSLRAGGPARFFAEPGSPDDVVAALAWAAAAGLPVVYLGAGTNTLFSDDGFSGLVLSLRALRGMRIQGTRITAAAGEPLPWLAWAACEAGLAGLEWACGVPGTVGGAVTMNAGAHGGDMARVLSSATLADAEGARCLSADDLGFGYRTSRLLEGLLSGAVVESTVKLVKANAEDCLARARALIKERVSKLPIGASAGSIFRNPLNGPSAGELLDRAGCRGLRVGRARVSNEHANVIVNEGWSNAFEVLRLIEEMKARVMRGFGVALREEIVIRLEP